MKEKMGPHALAESEKEGGAPRAILTPRDWDQSDCFDEAIAPLWTT